MPGMLAFLREVAPHLLLQPGAEEAAITQAQRDLGCTFPDEYLAFLRTSNGAEGMLASGDYVVLWPAENLTACNHDYQIAECCPEVVAFGSNDGGEVFVFRRSNGHIAIVPLIGLELDQVVDVAPSFTEFLENARPDHWE